MELSSEFVVIYSNADIERILLERTREESKLYLSGTQMSLNGTETLEHLPGDSFRIRLELKQIGRNNP